MAGPSAQYVVDIAANLAGGKNAIVELDALSDKLIGSGAGAEDFAAAIADVAKKLTGAEAASIAANTALSAGEQRYKDLEKAAIAAGKAEEKAAKLGVVSPDVAAAAVAATNAVNEQARALAQLEANASISAKAEADLATSLTNVRKLSDHAGKAIAEQAAAADAAAKAIAAAEAKESAAFAAAKAQEIKAADAAAKAIAAAEANEIKAAQDAAKAIAAAEAHEAKAAQDAAKQIAAAADQEAKALDNASKASLQGAKSFLGLEKASNFFKSLGSSEGKALLAAGAVAGITVAVVALTAALVVGIVKIAAWAIGLADSSRAAALHQEALAALDPAYLAVAQQLGGLTKETGLGTKELNALTKSLIDAKVSSEELPAALEAAALAESALGTGGAADFIAQLKDGKKTVGEFAAESKSKFGGIVAKQMKGLDAQTARLHANIGELFGGLNIDSVLSGLDKLVGLFDKTSASGKAIQFLFEKIFQPLIDNADAAATTIEAFVLGFEIGMVKTYIAAKPVIKAVSELFGFEDMSLEETIKSASAAGEAIVPVFLYAVGAFAALTAAIGVVVAAFVGFVTSVITIPAMLSSLGQDMGKVGADMISGLARGIWNGAGQVVSAITGVAGDAINAAKRTLGIASPSKVFAGIGEFTSEGFAEGVDNTAPDAQSALTDMVSPPAMATSSALSKQDALSGNFGGASAPVAAPAESGGGGAASGASVNLAGATFNFYGVEGAEDAERRFGEMLTRTLEGDAASLGTQAAA